MKNLNSIICIGLIIINCGCAPVVYDYYKPIANSGKLSSYFGPFVFAPDDVIKFTFEKSRITLKGGSKGFYLIVFFPKEKHFRFVSDEIEWRLSYSADKKKTKFHLSFYDIDSGKKMIVNPTDMVILNSRKPVVYNPGSGRYEGGVKLFDIPQDHYFIKLPAIEIDNQIFQIPTIEFIKKKGFGIISING